MQKEKQVSTQFGVLNHHTQNLHKTIKDFYSFADPSDFIKANNDLLNTYLEKDMDQEDAYTIEHIQDMVLLVSFQNQFLTALKEGWERYKKISIPKIETI